MLSTLYNNLYRKGLRISKHILEPKGINLEWDEVLKLAKKIELLGLAKEENSVAFGRDTGLAITDKGFSIIKDYGTYTNYLEVGQKERMSKPHQILVVESDNMDDLGEIYQVKDKSIFKKNVSKKRLTRIQIIQIIFGVISTIAALILIYEFLIN